MRSVALSSRIAWLTKCFLILRAWHLMVARHFDLLKRFASSTHWSLARECLGLSLPKATSLLLRDTRVASLCPYSKLESIWLWNSRYSFIEHFQANTRKSKPRIKPSVWRNSFDWELTMSDCQCQKSRGACPEFIFHATTDFLPHCRPAYRASNTPHVAILGKSANLWGEKASEWWYRRILV